MQGMIEVNDPTDHTELSYAIEMVLFEAIEEHDLNRHEVAEVLSNYECAVKKDKL